jgi:hypothetical protein
MRTIFDKIIRDQPLTDRERMKFLAWTSRQETGGESVPPETTETQLVAASEVAGRVVDMLSSRSLIPQVSDITRHMGLMQAGEFRVGNDNAPGDGFTGGRFGYPGFTYGGTEYFLAGVANDVLQVGLSLTNGTLTAGAGDVTIDSTGIWISNQQAAFGFEDTNGDINNIYLYSDAGNNLGLINRIAGAGVYQTITMTDAELITLQWVESAATDNRAILSVPEGSAGAGVLIGSGISLYAGADGLTTVINDDSFDVDFRVEGATNPSVFVVDAGNDRVELRNSSNVATIILDPNAGMISYFNENNEDRDFIFEGDTAPINLISDAGLDAIGIGGGAASGYKLKVHGDVHAANSSVRSFSVPLSDDTATSFTPTTTAGGALVSGGSQGGFIAYNTVSGNAGVFSGSANFAAGGGVLSGTTGVDGNFTVNAHTDGKIYLENRTGGTRNVTVLLI